MTQGKNIVPHAVKQPILLSSIYEIWTFTIQLANVLLYHQAIIETSDSYWNLLFSDECWFHTDMSKHPEIKPKIALKYDHI